MRGCRELCMERCREGDVRDFMLNTNFILSPFNAECGGKCIARTSGAYVVQMQYK
jgi:hypothetical protein